MHVRSGNSLIASDKWYYHAHCLGKSDMNHAQTYLFYDLETSGLNPAFDQILQFAAIRTDQELQELSRHEIRIRLRPDIIPSPGALLTTDVSVLNALTTSFCEYDAIQEIHTLFNHPHTINVGYNSFAFDDQFLRFAFFRNLLPAYTHQWQHGCKRLDIFPITVFYWLKESPLLTWPILGGKPILKLECLNQENNLAEGQAHDALVDVAATVELARRLQQDATQWQACSLFFEKSTFTNRLNQLPKFMERPYALLIDGKFGYEQNCQIPVLFLGETNIKGKQSVWLHLDKPELKLTTPTNITETSWVVRKKAGEPPFIMSPEPHKLNNERRNITRYNLKWLQQHPQILTAITDHYLNTSFGHEIMPDTDAALYAIDFPSAKTKNKCHQFHQADLTSKLPIIQEFQDDVTKELAIRLLCRNYGIAYYFPSYQAYQQQICDEERPLQDFRGHPRLTPKAALAEIEVARQNSLTPKQRAILSELEAYICYQFDLDRQTKST